MFYSVENFRGVKQFAGAIFAATLIAACSGGDANTQNKRITVDISGTHTIGRSPEEILAAYKECSEIMENTNQPQSICEPMEGVFGDNPQRPINFPEGTIIEVDQYERSDSETGLPILTSHEEAAEICAADGGELPTKEEWEVISTDWEGEQVDWPWGNEDPTVRLANLDLLGGNPTNPMVNINSPSEAGQTNESVRHMVGRASEWTDSYFPSDGFPIAMGGGSGTIPPFADPKTFDASSVRERWR